MPAKHHIDNNEQLIITTWDGEATGIELLDAIIKYQNTIQNHPDYIRYNEVVDFSNVTGIKVTSDAIKNISQIASKTDKQESNRKLALIVCSNLAFGLARMYEIYRGFSKNAYKKIRVFKNEKDAYEWVKVDRL